MQAANTDVMFEEEFAKLRRRILEAIAVPMNDGERRRARGTRVWVDARQKEKEENENSTKGRLTH